MNKLFAELILIGDKFKEIYGYSIEENTIHGSLNHENQINSNFQSLEGQSLGVTTDKANESSLCNIQATRGTMQRQMQ